VRKSRFNEEQIIGILKESEAGVPTPEPFHRYSVCAAIPCSRPDRLATPARQSPVSPFHHVER
jgi:hypothetical protein